MDLMEAALLVGIGLVLLGYLLVVRAGFRREFAWGVINLIPVVSLAFVMLYWRQARVGFVLSILGLLVVAGALYGGADSRLEQDLARLGYPVEIPMPVQRARDMPIPNEEIIRRLEEETGQRLELVEDNPFAVVQVDALPPLGSFRVEGTAPVVAKAWREAVEAELPRLVGERMRLQMSSGGPVREGFVAAVTPTTVFIQQMTSLGSVSFEYRLSEVTSMEVWDVRGAEPRVPVSEIEPVEDVIFAPPAN